MSATDYLLQRNLRQSQDKLNAAALAFEPGNNEDISEWTHLLAELKLSAGMSTLQIKADHEIISAAIEAIK